MHFVNLSNNFTNHLKQSLRKHSNSLNHIIEHLNWTKRNRHKTLIIQVTKIK